MQLHFEILNSDSSVLFGYVITFPFLSTVRLYCGIQTWTQQFQSNKKIQQQREAVFSTRSVI
jgi:hypothetical protein